MPQAYGSLPESGTDPPLFPFGLKDPKFSTSDCQEGVRYLSRVGHQTLRPIDEGCPLEFAHWRLSLDHAHLDFVKMKCGTEFCVEQPTNGSMYIFQFPIAGTCLIQNGRNVRSASPGNVFVINPRESIIKRWRSPCTQLMVQVDEDAIMRLLAAELDRDFSEPLIFDPSVQDRATASALTSLTRSIWHQMSVHEALGSWRVVRAFERTLLITYLSLLTHNYAELFRRRDLPLAPYYVKRAEEFIHSNVQGPIEIEDLVRVAGVSVRSLYYGFRKWRGTTPMNYLKVLRLNLAHGQLKRSRNEHGSVTQIALSVGYDHLSRFSKDYKQHFGESPSATLLQANQ